MGQQTSTKRLDAKDQDVLLPPLVLVVQAVLWSNNNIGNLSDEQPRKPAEVLGMMKTRCVILLNEVEVGHTLEFPSIPITIPKGPAKSKVMLRFFDVRGKTLPGGSPKQIEAKSPRDLPASTDALAEVCFTLAEVIPFGVPLYTSLWLGLNERQPGQGQSPTELHEALVRARDVSAPKVAVTIFKPAPLSRPPSKATGVPNTPAAPNPDLDGALNSLLEEKSSGGLDLGCTANRSSLIGPSLRDQVRGVMESVKVANTMTYSLQVAVWKRQQEGAATQGELKLGGPQALQDIPLEEVERALRKSKESDQVLQEKYGKKFECTQSALERALKANSELEVEREETKARALVDLERMRAELATAREESNRSFQRSTDLVEELESVRAELISTRLKLQSHDQIRAGEHSSMASLEEELAALREELDAERLARSAEAQETAALRDQVDGHHDMQSSIAQEIAALRAEVDAERAAKMAAAMEVETLRDEVEEERSARVAAAKAVADVQALQEATSRQMEEEIAVLRNEVDGHRDAKSSVAQEIAALRAEIDSERAARNSAKQDVVSLRLEVDTQKSEKMRAQKALAEMKSIQESSARQLEDAVRETNREKDIRQTEVQRLQGLVHQLESSLTDEQQKCRDGAVRQAQAEERARALALEVQDLKSAQDIERTQFATAKAAVKDLEGALEVMRTTCDLEKERLEAKRQNEVASLNTEIACLQTTLAAGGSRAEAQTAAAQSRVAEMTAEVDQLRMVLSSEKEQRMYATQKLGSVEAEAEQLRASLEQKESIGRQSLSSAKQEVVTMSVELAALKAARDEDIRQMEKMASEARLQARQLEELRCGREQERAQLEVSQSETSKLHAELTSLTTAKIDALKQVETMSSEVRAVQRQMQELEAASHRDRQKLSDTAEQNASLLREVAQLTASRDAEAHRVQTMHQEALEQTKELETLRRINEQERDLCSRARAEVDRVRDELGKVSTARAQEAQRAESLLDEGRQRSRELESLRETSDLERNKAARIGEEAIRLRDEINKLAAARAEESLRAESEGRERSKEIQTLKEVHEEELRESARSRHEVDRLREDLRDVGLARVRESEEAKAKLASLEADLVRAKSESERLNVELNQLTLDMDAEQARAKEKVSQTEENLRHEIEQVRQEGQLEVARRVGEVQTKVEEKEKQIEELMQSHKQYTEEVRQEREHAQLTNKSQVDQSEHRIEVLEQQLTTAKSDATAADSRISQLRDENVQLEAQLHAAVKDSEAADARSNRLREELRVTKDEMEALKEQEVKVKALQVEELTSLKHQSDERSQQLLQELQKVREETVQEWAKKSEEHQTRILELLGEKQEAEMREQQLKVEMKKLRDEFKLEQMKSSTAAGEQLALEVAKAREGFVKEQERLVHDHQQEVARVREVASKDLQQLQLDHQQEIARMREAAAKELEQVNLDRQQEATRARDGLAKDHEQLLLDHEQAIARMREAFAQEQEQLISEHKEEVARLCEMGASEKDQFILDQQQQATRAREAVDKEHEQLLADHQREVARVCEAAAKEQEQLILEHKQELSDLAAQLRNAEDQRDKLMADLDHTHELSKEQQYSARSHESQFEREMEELKGQRDSLEENNEAMQRELDQAKELLRQERDRVVELEKTRRQQQDTGSFGKTVADLRLQLQKAKQAHKEDLARFKNFEPGLKLMEQQKETHAEEMSSMTSKLEKLEAARAELQAELDTLRMQASTSRDKLHFLKNLVGRQQDTMACKGLQSPTSQSSPTSGLLRSDSGAFGSSTPMSSPSGRQSRLRMSIGLPVNSDPALPLADRQTPRGSLIVMGQQPRRSPREAPADTAKDVLVLKIFRKLVLEKFCQLTGEDLNKGLKLDSNPAFINRADLVKIIKRAEGNARTFTVKRAFNKFDPTATGKVNGDQFKQALEIHFKIEADPSNQLWMLILYVIREPSHPLFPWGASKKGGTGADTPRGSEVLTEAEFTKLLDHPRLIG